MPPAATAGLVVSLLQLYLWCAIPLEERINEFSDNFFNLLAFLQTVSFDCPAYTSNNSETLDNVPHYRVPLPAAEFIYRYPNADQKRIFAASYDDTGRTIRFVKWMVTLRPDFEFHKTPLTTKQAHCQGSGFPLRVVWELMEESDKVPFGSDYVTFLIACGVPSANVARLYPGEFLSRDGYYVSD